MSLTSAIISQIETLWYATIVHRMGDYCEMHAVLLKDPGQHISRVDGDSDDDAYRAACLLAEMVGMELEDG
jgi:hypothetical protein